jgi:hypothetical protein
MIFAFAKQSKADLTRIITTPGVFAAMGYWLMSQNISVPGIRPRVSVPGRIEMRTIFANDIPTCMQQPCISLNAPQLTNNIITPVQFSSKRV